MWVFEIKGSLYGYKRANEVVKYAHTLPSARKPSCLLLSETLEGFEMVFTFCAVKSKILFVKYLFGGFQAIPHL